jgi:hypothetical protein
MLCKAGVYLNVVSSDSEPAESQFAGHQLCKSGDVPG